MDFVDEEEKLNAQCASQAKIDSFDLYQKMDCMRF